MMIPAHSPTREEMEKPAKTPVRRVCPPDPLRALAERHRLRCYRDPCGDWNIPGRWGEIFWYGATRDGLPARIGVQLGGPHANGSPTRTTEKGANLRINRLVPRWGPPSQRGDGEAIFVLPADRILEAASAIGAKRRRSLSLERRAAAIERLQHVRQTRTTPNSRLGPCVTGQERGSTIPPGGLPWAATPGGSPPDAGTHCRKE